MLMNGSGIGFEQILDEATQAAETAVKSGSEIVKAARKARKAGLEGNIAALGNCPKEIAKALEGLRGSVTALELAIGRAAGWPETDADEQGSFEARYSAELQEAAAAGDLGIHERDGKLISYPTVLSVGSDRTLMIDQKKVQSVRPSVVVDRLRAEREKVGRYKPERFLEALFHIYDDTLKDQKKNLLGTGSMPPMPLIRIYKHLTALPGVSRSYTKTDFARDLFVLDSTGPKRAKRGKGPMVSFPSSSGTRARKDCFSFIGPDGFESTYYSIQFSEDS